MQKQAGQPITFLNEHVVLNAYALNNAISNNFALQGSLTDWAYGAGWDDTVDAKIDFCVVQTEPPLAADFFLRSQKNLNNVRAAIFRIQTDPRVDPA